MSLSFEIKNKIDPEVSIKIAPFKKDIRKTTPHKHNNYFEIIYLSQGKGLHTIDSKHYPVIPPILYIIRKEQIHYWALEDDPDGYVLILKKIFVDKSLDKELKALMAQISFYTCISLGEKDMIEDLFSLLAREYAAGQNTNTPIIEGLVKALFAKILQIAQPVTFRPSPKATLFQQFQDILSQEKNLQNNVSHYSSTLNTTPQNLNAVCRKAVGQSAAKVLAEYIINEAKRLLLYTDRNVAEIAELLNFKDSSHFVKYFKRYTAQTPLAFRTFV